MVMLNSELNAKRKKNCNYINNFLVLNLNLLKNILVQIHVVRKLLQFFHMSNGFPRNGK